MLFMLKHLSCGRGCHSDWEKCNRIGAREEGNQRSFDSSVTDTGIDLLFYPYTPYHLLQRKLPHKTINNFTSDWNDGTLVAALVDAMAPGLCPENEDMVPQNALQNASHAMKLAEDWLEVPQVSELYL